MMIVGDSSLHHTLASHCGNSVLSLEQSCDGKFEEMEIYDIGLNGDVIKWVYFKILFRFYLNHPSTIEQLEFKLQQLVALFHTKT